MKKEFANPGFTLVEVLIVVILLGILGSIAIVTFGDTASSARHTAAATTLKEFLRVLELARAHNGGEYPPDKTPGQIPDGVSRFVSPATWSAKTPLGGNWDWEYEAVGITAGLSIMNCTAEADEMRKMDAIVDDGNLSTGHFRANGSTRYTYILIE